MSKTIEFNESGYDMTPPADWTDTDEIGFVHDTIYLSFLKVGFDRSNGVLAAYSALVAAGYNVVDADGTIALAQLGQF